MAVDWDALRAAAQAAGERAYAPYSGLKVGAAGLTEGGEIVAGANVENASYGLTLCAECGVASATVASGARRLVAVTSVAADRHEHLAPCGRCRQVLYELGGPDLLVDGPDGPRPLGELLPDAFGPDDL